MPPQSPLDALSAPLEDAIARDLAWLLDAPDIVELKGYPGRPSRTALGLTHGEQGWLLRQKPAIQALSKKRVTRMGHYHEALWHLLLGQSPNTRLLAHNIAIRERRQTLGELDMLYRTQANPAPIHLEVAIKFYLGLDEGPDAPDSPNRWIGTGGLDSLARKCAHLHAHQLPLSATPLARNTLRHWLTPRDCPGEIGEITHQVAMPGVLFYPFHGALPPPRGATAQHERGRWCHRKEWAALLESAGEVRLAWLSKPFWMAPPVETAFHPPAALWPQIEACIERFGPQQVMLKADDGASERVFIVPDAWPREVPLPVETRA
ncbi:DUF1853 family protein [Halomonas sp. HMF6819]|uniref:DUF1853 family protein n=1 Tax=Halomonas sp. HMF6819 TaxID=3373085 RepID=UPI0037BA5951